VRPTLRIDQEGDAKVPPGTVFEIKTLRISGNTVFSTPTLHALVADAEGKRVELAGLMDLAGRITDYYRAHGYPLSRAIVRAQVIRDGVVDIEVVEARYGRIGLVNRSRVGDSLLRSTLEPLQNGDLVRQSEMEQALLLLSDIPGIMAEATLKPGEAVGTSDLLVNAEPGPSFVGNISADNYGNRFTGRARVGGSASLLNPLRHGDVLTATGLTSGSALNYGRVAYESLLNGHGTRLGAAYSALQYELGGALAPLRAHGTAQVASVWAKHPLVRRVDSNLYGNLQYDRLALRDRVDTNAIRTDRHLDILTAGLSGDIRDNLFAGAVSTWNIGRIAGRVGFDDAAARTADAASAATQGGFSKWNAGLARLQGLGPNSSVYAALTVQRAGTNLDSSQKMIAGGPHAVRAYDSGALSGDRGHLLSVEFRHDVGPFYGQLQAVAFIDSARVQVNRTPWVPGINGASLSGIGAGLNWTGADKWHARVYVASRVGPVPAIVASSASARAWIEIGKGF
jgi:hemolysin activation/secretion protein